MPSLADLIDRVERLLLRHDELKRTNALLQEQVPPHPAAAEDALPAACAARAAAPLLGAAAAAARGGKLDDVTAVVGIVSEAL